MDFLTYQNSIYFAIAALISGVLLILSYRKKNNGLSPNEAVQLSNSESAIFLDIRDDEEIATGTVAQARHITHTQLSEQIKTLSNKKPIIIIGANAKQEQGAMRLLKDNGFDRVYVLTNGIHAWKKEGLPLGKPSAYNAVAKKRKNK